MADRLTARVFAAVLAATAAGAQAQSLSDPTRPPGAGAMQGVQEKEPAGRQLQRVLMS